MTLFQTIEPSEGHEPGFGPPYIVEDRSEIYDAPRPSKKRQRDGSAPNNEPTPTAASNSVRVSTYQEPFKGPFPTDAPKANSIRFTPVQVEAITSGTQPGLTIIVGPPGTGKTDVLPKAFPTRIPKLI